MFFLLPQCISLDLEVGYEKLILTRTKTLSAADCFKDPLLLNTLFLKRKYFYLLFIAIRTWNLVPISFVFRDPQKLFSTPENDISKSLLLWRFA